VTADAQMDLPVARWRTDLIRVYARERAKAEEPASACREALVRVFGALLALTEIMHRADYTILRGDAPRRRPDLVTQSLPETCGGRVRGTTWLA
jgi:hypothetical protein